MRTFRKFMVVWLGWLGASLLGPLLAVWLSVPSTDSTMAFWLGCGLYAVSLLFIEKRYLVALAISFVGGITYGIFFVGPWVMWGQGLLHLGLALLCVFGSIAFHKGLGKPKRQ